MKTRNVLLLSTFFIFFFCFPSSLNSQDRDRKSPPATVDQTIDNGAHVVIRYSQPSVRGRKIFGGLVPYGKVWRTGANEASVIEFSRDVSVNGEKIKAGKYALFTIPGEKQWTVILNSTVNQWGAYSYSEEKDVVRFTATPEKTGFTDQMVFEISPTGRVVLKWENTAVGFEID